MLTTHSPNGNNKFMRVGHSKESTPSSFSTVLHSRHLGGGEQQKARKLSAFRRDDGKSPNGLRLLKQQNNDEVDEEDHVRSRSHSADKKMETTSLSPSQVQAANDRSKVPSSFATAEKERKPKKKRAVSRNQRDWKNPDNKLVVCTYGTHYDVIAKAARNVDFIDRRADPCFHRNHHYVDHSLHNVVSQRSEPAQAQGESDTAATTLPK